MANKYCFEAVDRSLRDIMKGIKEDYNLKPFGGITTVLGGDFRQILPIVRKGDRHDMIQACIKNSYLWNSCEVHLLRQNMSLQSNELDSISKYAMQNFADWILDVGDGKQCSDIGESWISIEQNLMLPKSHDDFQSIVDTIYPNLNSHIGDTDYLVSRAILTPTNEIVDDINQRILNNFTGEEMIYLSSNSICKANFNIQDQDLLYPTEFLNTLKFLGLPSHILRLKKGAVVMLMRNLNQGAGLCNGTRMKITQLGKWFVEGEVLSGSIIGDKVLIPRISLSPS